MAMSFDVHQIVQNPMPFTRGGTRLYAMGLLVVTAQQAYILDDHTEHQLGLSLHGGWLDWLPQEIPPLEGECLYLDQAAVAGLARVENGEVLWKYIWQVNIRRGGRWLMSKEHVLEIDD